MTAVAADAASGATAPTDLVKQLQSVAEAATAGVLEESERALTVNTILLALPPQVAEVIRPVAIAVVGAVVDQISGSLVDHTLDISRTANYNALYNGRGGLPDGPYRDPVKPIQ